MPNLVEVNYEPRHIGEYNSFLVDIKNKIKLSQQKAFNSVNQELIMLYFNIGSVINTRQNMSQLIGISEYELTEILPKEFESSLPSIEMIENELMTNENF